MKTFFHFQKDNSSNLILFRTSILASSKLKKESKNLNIKPMTISETKQVLKVDLFALYVTAVSVAISLITILSILN